jgi:TonB family protein
MAAKVTIKFKVYKEDELIEEKEFSQPAIKIGRLNTHHIPLDDDSVAMTHAVIQVSAANDVSLFSLDSEHPTLVNGEEKNKCKLLSGDIVSVGPYRLVTEIVDESKKEEPKAAAAPAQPPAQAPQPEQAPPAQAQAPAPGMPMAPPAPLPGMAPVPGMPGMTGEPQAEMTEAERTAAAARLIDLNTVEDTSKRVLEVIPIWKTTVFSVKHLAKDDLTFTIGEEPGCDFWLPPEKMGGSSKVTLATGNAAGGGTLHYKQFFEGGEITLDSGEQKDITEVVQPGGDLNVPDGARCKITFGDFIFLVNSVPAPKKPKLPFQIEWTYHSFNGASFLAVLIMMFMFFFFPPESRTLSLDQLSESNRFVKFLLEPQEIIPEEELPEWMTKKDKADDKEGGKGKRHKGEEGQMGDSKAKKTDNMYGIKGPADNPDPHMARDQKKDMAKGAGILSVLNQSLNMPTSPFGRDSALGTDAENALGALMGNQIGPNFGFGGLGLRGTGSGGGGTGEGTIGLGNLGTIGHGGGGGSGVGYGRGAGGLRGRGGGKVPKIKPGAAMVKGSLSKEVIRRVIRQHINEVRFCYESALSAKPDLAGRVSVQFVISPTGAVQTSKLAQSSLGNSGVENCIVKAVRRWTFPSPEGGGVVIVTYPFVLQPAGGA